MYVHKPKLLIQQWWEIAICLQSTYFTQNAGMAHKTALLYTSTKQTTAQQESDSWPSFTGSTHSRERGHAGRLQQTGGSSFDTDP